MSESRGRMYALALAGTLAVAFVSRMFVAYAMPNMVWPDEIFQTLEQAHRAVFGYGVIPWEFREGTRSWLLPGFLAGVIACAWWITSSVTGYLMAAAGSLAAISLLPLRAAFKLVFADYGVRGAIVVGGFVALWFELVYFGPKSVTEVVAGNLLAAGVLGASACLRERHAGTDVTTLQLVGVTFLLTLSAVLRIQLAVAAAATFFVLIAYLPARARWYALAIATATVLAGGLLDAITWDYPFQSFIKNIQVNILEGKSEYYGTAPWYAYFQVYARIWGAFGVLILALAIYGARRVPLAAMAAVLVLAAHVPIAHKEYRFVYPAMLLVIVLAGIGTASVLPWIEKRFGARTASLAVVGTLALWLAGSLHGARGFHGSKTQLAFTYGFEQDHWMRRRGGLVGMQILGSEPSICGVGLAGVGWGDTGGYTYLHRDIPLFPFPTQELLWQYLPHFNGLLMRPDPRSKIGPFEKLRCWNDACIYVRDGACTRLPDWDVNQVLERAGQ